MHEETSLLLDFDDLEVIDLSLPIDESSEHDPLTVRINRVGHTEGIRHLNRSLVFNRHFSLEKRVGFLFRSLFKGRRFRERDFPDNEFISDESVSCSVHAGTHVDGPFHFGTKCAGKRSRYISEVGLNYFIGPGVILDVSHLKPGDSIKKEDILRACKEIEYNFSEGDIILIKTLASRLWKKPDYFYRFPGMSREATEYIIDHGIKLIGIDAPGFDRPYGTMINEFFSSRDQTVLWPSHFLGREKEYYHMERLCNLEVLPYPKNFVFCGFPIKILNVGASWIRAVALISKKQKGEKKK